MSWQQAQLVIAQLYRLLARNYPSIPIIQNTAQISTVSSNYSLSEKIRKLNSTFY